MEKSSFALELSSQLFFPGNYFYSMVFAAVYILIKTHFHVFPPIPTWNLYLPTWNLEIFQDIPYIEHPLSTWNIHPKLKQLFWGGISS